MVSKKKSTDEKQHMTEESVDEIQYDDTEQIEIEKYKHVWNFAHEITLAFYFKPKLGLKTFI